MTTLILLVVNQAVARSHRFYNETKCAQRLTATGVPPVKLRATCGVTSNCVTTCDGED